MAKRSPSAPFQRLRRALLAALLVAVCALAGLYWLGRQGAPEAAPADGNADSLAVDSEPGALAASEGFEFEQKVAGRPVFRIAGDRFRAGKDSRIELEGVTLELFRDGEPYRVRARNGVYDSETQASRLEGGVEISGGDGFRLRTSAVDLSEGGRELVSSGPVELGQLGKMSGEAAGMRLDFAADRFVLEGPTRMRGRPSGDAPAVDLAASRIVIERRHRAVRAEGNVVLVRGGERIAAQQLALYLAEDEETPRTVQAKWEVEGRLESPETSGASAPVEFSAKEANLDFEGAPARPARITLEAERGSQVRLIAPGPENLRREIAARYLVATLGEGRLVAAQGFQPVYFAEYRADSPDRPLRTGQADQVEAEFDATGHPTRLTFVGHVSFRDEKIRGAGERGFIDLERGRAELFGEKVVVSSERGELTGPHLAWDRATGLVTADGGIQARLDPAGASLLAGAQAGARGPVRVEAQEAILQERPRGFVFRGRVQAWQGESVLLADQLRGEEAEQRLSAAGGVKTIWREAATAGTAPRQTEITAETLAYRRQERTIVYQGAVRMAQDGRTLTADELVNQLGPDDKIQRTVASGALRLEDAASGRAVEANRADYDLAARTALFEGSPVVLRDRLGTTIQGRRLLYDLSTGNARMLSEKP